MCISDVLRYLIGLLKEGKGLNIMIKFAFLLSIDYFVVVAENTVSSDGRQSFPTNNFRLQILDCTYKFLITAKH